MEVGFYINEEKKQKMFFNLKHCFDKEKNKGFILKDKQSGGSWEECVAKIIENNNLNK